MNNDASLNQTIVQPTPASDEPQSPRGTMHDPHRTSDFQAPPPSETAPDLPHVPGFVIEKELARGGMGIVFQARDTAMNRTVAIKILQERHASDSAIAARFLDEAQITGQLQHPGIPPIYQMGTLADGRPYLAMKLIRGETLHAKLQRREQINYLALMEAVAQAVGYAHAHGVIHRDLKPSNIMVGVFGEVQVMDWGLAKVLRQGDKETRRQGEETEDSGSLSPCLLVSPSPDVSSPTPSDRTQAGSVLGTPAYMSPEQAAGEISIVDARSDVFGLGGVLCCILTGQPPYPGTDIDSVRLRAVRGQTGDALTRLNNCSAEPEVIALCKRCLSFVPDDRPADGNAIAQELAGLRAAAEERARRAEINRAQAEVAAREQSKRRRVVQWAGGIIAAVLALGMVSTGIGLFQANAARQAAQTAEEEANARRREAVAAREEEAAAHKTEAAARQKADEQLALALAVTSFLKHDLLRLADPATQQQDPDGGRHFDANVKLRDVVLRAAKVIDNKFTTRPEVEAELRGTIGYALLGMGRPDLALAQLERTRTLCGELFGADHPTTLHSWHELARCYTELGRHPEALGLLEHLVARRKAVLGFNQPPTLNSMNSLANCYAALGRHAEAVKLHEACLSARLATIGPDHQATLASMHNLAGSYRALGQHMRALNLSEMAVKRQREALGPDHLSTLTGMNNLAACYLDLGRHAEALQLWHEVVTRQKTTLGPDHPETLSSMNNLVSGYLLLGRVTEAVKLSEDTVARQKATLGPDHLDTLRSMINLSACYEDLGRHADALKVAEDTLARLKATRSPDHLDVLHCTHNLAGSYRVLGRPAEAVKLYEDLIPRRKAILGPNHVETLASMHDLASSYRALGRPAEAIKLYEETLTRRKATLGPDHPDTLHSMNDLAICYTEAGRPTDAVKLYQEVAQARERRATKQPKDLDNLISLGGLHCNIGHALRSEGQFAESLQAYGRAIAHLETVLWQQPKTARAKLFLRNAHYGRAIAHENLHRYPDADADWTKAIDLSPENQKAAETRTRDEWKAKRPSATTGTP